MKSENKSVSIYSVLNHGIEPSALDIQVNSFFQLPGIHLVGLPSTETNESKDRIRSAIDSSGFEIPKRKIIINFSLACIKKKGTHYQEAGI